MNTIEKLNPPVDSSSRRIEALGTQVPETSNRQRPQRTILVVTKDPRLVPNLRLASERAALAVTQARELEATLRFLHDPVPVAILLDLDLPCAAAWKIADHLLRRETCPPLILLTGRTDQFDTATAIRAGALFDKSLEPSKLLDVIDQVAAQSDSGQADRNSIQRVLIQWLKPCSWSIPVTPAQRFWGINE
jgi:DNA-binding response OmpR family regulator